MKVLQTSALPLGYVASKELRERVSECIEQAHEGQYSDVKSPKRMIKFGAMSDRLPDLLTVIAIALVAYAAKPSARSSARWGSAPIACAWGSPFSNRIMFGIERTP